MKPRTSGNEQQGFTLIELLVAVAIMMVILVAAYNVIDASQQISAHQHERADMDSSARVALDLMSSEIREAGFNPNGFRLAQMTPANVPFIEVDASKTLGEAIDFRADLNGNGVTVATLSGVNTEPNEWIRYEWTDVVSGVGNLVRWTDSNGDGSLDERVVLASNVQKALIGATAQNIFTCYTALNAEITDKANIASSKSLRIWFTVRAAKKDRVKKQYPLITLQSRVSLRDLRQFPF